MIATLWDKTGKVKLGELVDILNDSYSVEEERNGIFELVLDYPNDYPLSDKLIEENFVEVKPNDDQLPQKFRIYDTKKFMDNIITVYARHQSFDLANDHAENINLENASCEYALNTLFRNSHFSKDFRGYSDIVNAQDYKIDNVNILNAIAGKEGSIIDTYGTGAEILRDGKNIHVLNKRGHDNGVTIEYGKNLTGFELDVDLTGLETRCGGFAKYKSDGSQEEVIVKSDWIDSPFIDNFAHPYINTEGRRDYSDKFKDGKVPTKEALNKLCQDEFKINKRDVPASNYRIEFIPLSKCVGYEGIEDEISLCDTVTIIDPRFNINTKAKVIKYKYDFIKERYISMELGEPRTTLGDIIGSGGDSQVGPPGPPGPPGADGNIGDFPNSLPATPILTATVKGFASIDLSWTFEDKVYYTYELYASKTKDFTPNTFDLIHSGQSSSFLFQAKPNETWYFRVCAKNTHGDRTSFGPQVTVVTNKADNFDEYFSNLAVGNLVTNIFSADYMEAGIIKGNWIDARQLTVTDGNGKRPLDIDSFGRITLMPSVFKLLIDGKEEDVATLAQLKATSDKIEIKFEQDSSTNIIKNSDFSRDALQWQFIGDGYGFNNTGGWKCPNGKGLYIDGQLNTTQYFMQYFDINNGLEPNADSYTFSAYTLSENIRLGTTNPFLKMYVEVGLRDSSSSKTEYYETEYSLNEWKRTSIKINKPSYVKFEWIKVYFYARDFTGRVYISQSQLNKGDLRGYVKNKDEIYAGIIELDIDGIRVKHNSGSSSKISAKDLGFYDELNRKKLGFYRNAMMTYDWINNRLLNYIGSAYLQDWDIFGTIISSSKHGKFIDFSRDSTAENDDDNFGNTESFLRIALEDFTNMEKGTHVYNYPLYLHNKIDMKEYGIFNANNIDFVGDSKIARDSFGNLVIGSKKYVNIGRVNSDHSITPYLEFDEGEWAVNSKHWNWQNYKLLNAQINADLNGYSRAAYGEKRELSYSKTMHEEIRMTGESVIENGKCLIPIEPLLQENCKSYSVHLTPYSNSLVYVKEKKLDSVVVACDNDIEFSYEIIIKQNKVQKFVASKKLADRKVFVDDKFENKYISSTRID